MSIDNIIKIYKLATPEEKRDGIVWYANAYADCNRIALDLSVQVHIVTGVVAALSPNNKWERNIIDAESIIKCWRAGATRASVMHPKNPCVRVCTYGKNKAKAWDILTFSHVPDAGVSPIASILNGKKVVEFFNCITNPLLNDVCIDGHAYSVWYGQRLTMKEVPNIGKKLRAQIKTDYRDATTFINEELGTYYSASTIQAITWVTHKRIHNV